MKKQIKICFAKMGKDMIAGQLFNILRKNFNVSVDDKNPDVVFFSVYSGIQPHKNIIRVLFTGENKKPVAETYDFSFSFDDSTATNFCLPPFILTHELKQMRANITPKTNFCNFIYHNEKPQERIIFCEHLMRYKKVDCPGSVLTNREAFGNGRHNNNWRDEKIGFIKPYKFTIAFENESYKNYVTEKIWHPFLVGSIPIYWGAPNINEYFDPNSFINAMNYNSHEELVEYVKYVDNNDDIYMKYIAVSPINDSSKLNNINENSIIAFFDKIFKGIK